ncbi:MULTISPECIES: CPBP family intramembrane glutamic endopeptidase [Psychrilyobacter]|uniref:CPBP family intramembrane metalloprotease n=3 Tax=Psychrilyobacter TaxID=623282 RepID=A0ABX9KF10_9FUSO|nr:MULTISPECIES: type II CAAX endopeptidase family protein [Psychrilyobacter]NDI78723.1 CPBP family intramembrane metalloprotease [Psychrilyobacter piezotolerans]RDE59898.1 CPBP family intramembrane metalloprotease [Psychrilyobacter sp. S5]REI40179.1 CPBP family intramembrane metalloprotease [Psychrilyobacter piezotolerans]
MENQARESKFELSVLGALGIMGSTIFYVFIIFAGLLIFLFPIGLIIGEFTPVSFEKLKEIANLLSEPIFKIILIVVAVKKAKKISDNNFRISYLGKLNYKLLLSVILLMIGYYFWYQSSIGVVTNKIPLPEFLEEVFKDMELHPYPAIFSIAIIAPIYEEIFMRGIILAGLLNRYSPKKAIIISALIFGISHFNIVQSVNATLIGLILGMIYYKTNSLILCIAVHMTNNIFAMIMGVAKEYMGYSPNIISFLAGVIIFIGSAMLFFRYLRELGENLGW